jgi:hypothetical protein
VHADDLRSARARHGANSDNRTIAVRPYRVGGGPLAQPATAMEMCTCSPSSSAFG